MSEKAELRGFGFPCEENAIFAWGARALFSPTRSPDRPLDLLGDRQGYYYPGIGAESEGGSLYQKFLDEVNKLMPWLQTHTKWFEINSSSTFCEHFPYDPDPRHTLVVTGSPNGSSGYFYLSVSLVENGKPKTERKEPDNLVQSRHAAIVRKAKYMELTAQMRAWELKKKLLWREKNDREHVLMEREFSAEFKEPGKTLESGNRIEVDNKEDVYWFVLFANQRQALVERYTVKGTRQLLTVDLQHHKRSTHTRIPDWATAEGYVE